MQDGICKSYRTDIHLPPRRPSTNVNRTLGSLTVHIVSLSNLPLVADVSRGRSHGPFPQMSKRASNIPVVQLCVSPMGCRVQANGMLAWQRRILQRAIMQCKRY